MTQCKRPLSYSHSPRGSPGSCRTLKSIPASSPQRTKISECRELQQGLTHHPAPPQGKPLAQGGRSFRCLHTVLSTPQTELHSGASAHALPVPELITLFLPHHLSVTPCGSPERWASLYQVIITCPMPVNRHGQGG